MWVGSLIIYSHHWGCLNNPISSNLGLCAACWAHFVCRQALRSTSVSHPFSLNSILGKCYVTFRYTYVRVNKEIWIRIWICIWIWIPWTGHSCRFVGRLQPVRAQLDDLMPLPWEQGLWGQHVAHLGPTGPRWAPCWPHGPCYLGSRLHWRQNCIGERQEAQILKYNAPPPLHT